MDPRKECASRFMVTSRSPLNHFRPYQLEHLVARISRHGYGELGVALSRLSPRYRRCLRGLDPGGQVCTRPLHIPRIRRRCRKGMTRRGLNVPEGRASCRRAPRGSSPARAEKAAPRKKKLPSSGVSFTPARRYAISSSRRPRTSAGCGRRPASRARPDR
jgi:hypothetical protein